MKSNFAYMIIGSSLKNRILLVNGVSHSMFPHKFNYDLMKELNDGKQMTDVWRMPAIGRWEKTCGKHPTQKPLRLLVRMILASTNQGDWVLDPFSGSSTTGIAANLCGRRFAGLEQEEEFCKLSKARREELENLESYDNLISHIGIYISFMISL